MYLEVKCNENKYNCIFGSQKMFGDLFVYVYMLLNKCSCIYYEKYMYVKNK